MLSFNRCRCNSPCSTPQEEAPQEVPYAKPGISFQEEFNPTVL